MIEGTMNGSVLLITGIILLIITYRIYKRYERTLNRMSGPRSPTRASPEEDLHLVFIILIAGITGGVSLGFGILITLFGK